MWTIGICEKEPFALHHAIRQMFPEGEYELRRLSEVTPDKQAQDVDILLVEGEEPPDISCRRAVLPGQRAGALPVRAEGVVTYGLSGKDTLTVSSSVDRAMALALQREIVDIGGRRVDRQEILVNRPSHMGVLQTLACVGGLLILGVDPERIPELLSGGLRS